MPDPSGEVLRNNIIWLNLRCARADGGLTVVMSDLDDKYLMQRRRNSKWIKSKIEKEEEKKTSAMKYSSDPNPFIPNSPVLLGWLWAQDQAMQLGCWSFQAGWGLIYFYYSWFQWEYFEPLSFGHHGSSYPSGIISNHQSRQSRTLQKIFEIHYIFMPGERMVTQNDKWMI